jgi:hypothetical protein
MKLLFFFIGEGVGKLLKLLLAILVLIEVTKSMLSNFSFHLP